MANISAKGLRVAIKEQFLASRRRWMSAMDSAWFDIAKGIVKHLTEQDDPLLFLRSDGEWAAPVPSSSGVPTTRLVSTTSPLSGGGDLSVDRTLSVSVGTGAGDVAAGNHTHTGGLSQSDADPQIMLPPWFGFKDVFTVTTVGSTDCHAYYFGRATQAYTSFTVRLRVANQISGATWGEVAIGKSTAPVAGTNKSITVVGYVDMTGTHNTIGNKSTVVAVSVGQSIAVGDHLWMVIAKLSTGSPTYRSISTVDELDFGIVLDAGNVRPSVILGTPTTFNAGQSIRNPIHFGVYPS